jgi:hypothetical protein
MPEISELERLAEADGATFIPSGTGAWSVKDRHGMVIVRGALSRVEAAVLYCEDRVLTAATPEAILATIRHQYRPYDTMLEFDEGFAAYQSAGPRRRDPYDGVKAQAGPRGKCRDALRPGAGAPRRPPYRRRFFDKRSEGRPGLAGHAPPDGEVLTWTRSRSPPPRCSPSTTSPA